MADVLEAMVVKIDADPPVGGEYTLEPKGGFFFTSGEFHLIKKETGLRPAEIDEAAQAGDTDVMVAFALVALQRAGFPIGRVRDVVWSLDPGRIGIDQLTKPDGADTQLPPASGVAGTS